LVNFHQIDYLAHIRYIVTNDTRIDS
jgi:hypothetical protein